MSVFSSATAELSDPNRRYWDERAQLLSPFEVRALQDERLRVAVGRVYERAPFFRRLYGAEGVVPDDVKGVDDIVRLPIIAKDDLRNSEAQRPPIGDYRCVGIEGAVRFTTSTGTTGKPTIALWTRDDLVLDFELSARVNWRAGLRPGMVVVNAHPGYLNGGESFIAGDCQYMGMLPISLGPPDDAAKSERSLRAIEGVNVDHWRLFPAALHRYREVAERAGIAVRLPEPEEFGAARQYEKLSAGQECISVLGGQCSLRNGAHLAEDYAVVEVLDRDRLEPVPEGTRGVLVVTSLGRDNPLIRYNTEDIVRVEAEPCPCGEPSRRGFYEGRSKDVVTVAGRMVLPIDVWFELPPDAEYQIVRRSQPMDRLTVRIEHEPKADLAERLAQRTGVPVDVEVVSQGGLPRAFYKQTLVVDE